ncbi:MAG: AMP-binding protein, partial [Bacteroidota bacterium]
MEPYLKCDTPLKDGTRNIGTMLLNNRDRYGDMNAFAQVEEGPYQFWTWHQLVDDIITFAAYLETKGLKKGDHIGIISRNYYHRLVVELAVMSSGYVCVPIFHRYTEEMMSHLLEFSDVKMLILVNYWRLEYLPTDDKPLLVMATPEFPRKKYPFENRVEFYEDVMRKTNPTPEERREIERSFR